MKKLYFFLMLILAFCLPSALIAQQTLPYSYGFEDNNLSTDGWTLVGASSSSTKILSSAKHSGSYGFQFYYSERNACLLSPELTGTENGVSVSFWYRTYSSSYSEQFQVGYTTRDTVTDPDQFIYGDTIATGQVTDWFLFDEVFPAGTKKIAIKYIYTNGFYLYLDDFSFTAPATCPKVTGLTVLATETHDAHLSWTAGGNETAWDIYVTTNADAPTAETTPSVGNTPNNQPWLGVLHLSPATHYYAYVRARCSESDRSVWSQAVEFTTDCEAVTSFPWTEDFDSNAGVSSVGSSTSNNLPVCWNYINTCTNNMYKAYPLVYNYSDVSHSGNNHLRFYSYYTDDPQDQYAILPQMQNVSGLRIKLYTRNFTQYVYGAFIVGVMTDPADAATFTAVDTISPSSTNYEFHTIPFNGYHGNGEYIAIKMLAANESHTSCYLIIDDITVEELPSCLEPTNLEVMELNDHEVKFTWTAGGDETLWDLYYTTSAEAPTAETVPSVGGTNNPQPWLTGLTPQTHYYAYVRARCSESDRSAWSSALEFTTACGAVTTFPWTEDLENYNSGAFSDPCWVNERIQDGTGNGSLDIFNVTTSSNSGNTTHQLKLPDMKAGTKTMLRLPKMTLVPGTIYQFVMDVYRDNNSKADEGVRILASIDGQINGATELGFIPHYYNSAPAETATGWYTYEFPIPTTGVLYIILLGESQYGTATYMDNLVVEQVPTCLKPSALTCASKTAHTATLQWTNGDVNQDAWQIVYSTDANFNPDTMSAPVDVTTNPATISGLEAETTYYAYVRANCGNDDYSAWSKTKTNFTTVSDCQTPDGLTVTEVTTTSAVLRWTTYGLSDFNLRYKAEADNGWTVMNAVSSPFTFTGLAANTAYQVQVQAACNTEAWSATTDFRTECEAITITENNPYTEDFESPVVTALYNTNTDADLKVPYCWGESYAKTTSGSTPPACQKPHLLKADAGTSGYNYSNPASQVLYFYGDGYGYAMLPEFTNPLNELQISFKWATESQTNGILYLGYITANDVNYNSFKTIKSFQAYNSGSYHKLRTDSVYLYNVPDSASRLAFYWYANNQWGANIDDIEVSLAPTCPPLLTMGGAASDSVPHSIGALWFPVEGVEPSSYTMRYGIVNDPEQYIGGATIDTIFCIINNLYSDSLYYIHVRANCGNNDYSEWTTVSQRTPVGSCATVTNLHVDLTGNGTNSAIISWNSSESTTADVYDIHVSTTPVRDLSILENGNCEFPWATRNTTFSLPNNTYPNFALTPNTTYYVYVRVHCNLNDGNSDWAETSFTTLSACRVPVNASVRLTGKTSATVTWESGDANQADNYKLIFADQEMSAQALENAQAHVSNWQSTSYSFSGTYGQTFYIYVANNCGNEGNSPYVYAGYVTFPNSCPPVQNLTASNVTANTVQLSWNRGEWGDETQWYLQRYLYGSWDNPESTTLVNDSIVTVFGLQPETTYAFHVSAKCDEHSSSLFSDMIAVTTLAAPRSCYPVANSTVNATTNSTTPVFGYNCDNKQKTQSIYPAAMLTDLLDKTITGLKYYVESGSSNNGSRSWETKDFTVRLAIVNDSSLASGFVTPDNYTTVYTGTLSASTATGMEISFNGPAAFTYTGGNLLVEFELPEADSYVTCVFNGISSTGSSRYAYGNSYATSSGTVQNFLPKVDFCTVPSACPAVTDLAASNVTAHSAHISWMPGSSETQWNVLYSATEMSEMDLFVADWDRVNDINLDLANLNASTTYYVYVYPVMIDSNACWDNMCHVSFTTPATCLPPTNIAITNITTTTATISWEYVDGFTPETGWMIYYGTDPQFAQGTYGYTAGDAPSPFIIGSDIPLQANTTYYLKMQCECSSNTHYDVSVWTDVYSFATSCEAIVVDAEHPFTENFDTQAFPPTTCWSRINSDTRRWIRVGASEYNHSGAVNGSAFAGFWGDIYLIMPDLTLANDANDVNLTFWSKNSERMSYVSNNNSVVLLDGNNETVLWSPRLVSGEWEETTVNLNQYKGQTIRLAFKHTGNDVNGWYLDDITVEEISSCLEPAQLSVDSVGIDEAQLSWIAGGNETLWDIYYTTSNEAPTVNTIPTVGNTDNNRPWLTRLTPGAHYYVYVRSRCSESDFSPWTAAVEFTTTCETITSFPWSENFDSYVGERTYSELPVCWSYINTSTSSQVFPAVCSISLYSHSGNNHMRLDSYISTDPQDEYAILPRMQNINGLRIQFDARKHSDNIGGTVSVGVMTNPADASTFTTIESFTPDTTEYEHYTISFRNYNGAGEYIALMMPGANQTNPSCCVCIDDIVVEEIPYSITINQVTGGTITVNVVDNIGNAYSSTTDTSAIHNAWVQLDATADNGYTFGNYVVTTASGIPIEIINSGFTMPDEDVTVSAQWNLVPCLAPENLVVANGSLTATSALVTWNSNQNNTFGGVYYESGVLAGSNDQLYQRWNLTELQPNTNYRVGVFAYCSLDRVSDTVWVEFNTNDTCYPPVSVSISDVTAHTAKLSYDFGAHVPHDFMVHTSLDPDFNIHGTLSTMPEYFPDAITLDNYLNAPLQSGTTYYVRMASQCGPLFNSVWSETLSFTTLQEYAVAIDANITNGTVTADNTVATAGTVVNLTATPDNGYSFGEWVVTTVNTPAPETVTVTNNSFVMPEGEVNISATFTPNSYNITLNPGTGGTIVITIDDSPGIPLSTTANYNSVINIVPVPHVGYSVGSFVVTNADGSVIPTPDSSFIMPANDVTITGTFIANEYTVTYMDGNTVLNVDTFTYRTAITPMANPTKEGYTFTGWDPELPQTMPAEDLTVNAQWQINTYNIVLNQATGGTTVLSIDGSVGTYVSTTANYNALVEITPVPHVGYSVGSVVVTNPDGSVIPTPEGSFIMPANDVTITATYMLNTYTVTTAVNPANAGTVIGAGTYNYGSEVEMRAEAADGYIFSNWTNAQGSVVSTDAIFDFEITNDTAFTANFTAMGVVATPTFSPAGGTYYDSLNVTLACTTEGATIHYTTDGTTPTAESAVYSTAISIAPGDTTVIKAIAMKDEMINSEVVSATYVLLPMYEITISENIVHGSVIAGLSRAAEGTTVRLVATADNGYHFGAWNVTTATGMVEVTANNSFVMPASNVTVGATFEANEYSITYMDGNSILAQDTFAFGATITPMANPTKEGYTFTGWTPELPATMPDSNIIVDAQWQINSYNITLNPGTGGTIVITIDDSPGIPLSTTANYNSVINIIPVPHVGYSVGSFVVTNADGSVIPTPDSSFVMPANDVTITGYFIANEYTITYMDGNDVLDVDTFAFGATVTPMANPTKEGYTFIGWNLELPATMPDYDMRAFAQWAINKYAITYMDGNDILAQDSVIYGAAITPIANPTKEGYTFAGWDPQLPQNMPANDVTVNAQWELIPCLSAENLAVADGSLTTTSALITWNSSQDNTFGGIYYENGELAGSNNQLYQRWNLSELQPGTNYRVGVFAYCSLDRVSDTVWVEFNTNDTCYPPVSVSISDVTAHSALLSYDFGEHVPGDFMVHISSDPDFDDYDAVSTSTAADYFPDSLPLSSLVGLNLQSGTTYYVRMASQCNTNTGLTSVWTEPISFTTLQEYAVTIDANIVNGNITTDYTVATAGTVINLTATPDNGYSFGEWVVTTVNTPAPEIVTVTDNSFVMPASDVNISATFTINSYNITLNPGTGGTIVITIDDSPGIPLSTTANYNSVINIIPVPHVGYSVGSFVVTNADGSVIPTPDSSFVMPANDVTITGYFIANEYTITYMDGNTVLDVDTFTFGTTITSIDNPTKEGYTFTGWTPELPATMPDSNIIVDAQWQINSYNITLNPGTGGTIVITIDDSPGIPLSTTANYNSVINIVPVPHVGYSVGSFVVTNADGSVIPTPDSSFVMPANDVTITGYFIANEYTITYLDGNTVLDVDTFTFGATITPMANPTREGYTFTGWTPALPTTMPAEDLTVNAQWQINSYDITINQVTGGTITVSFAGESATSFISTTTDTAANYETWIQLSAAADYAYDFVDFVVTTASGDTIETPNNGFIMPAENVTVTAVFTIQNFNITVNVSNDTPWGTVTGSGSFAYGSLDTLTAIPDEHYLFLGWSDFSTENPRVITVTHDSTFTAYFIPMNFDVNVTSNDTTMGVVNVSIEGPVGFNTPIVITAIPVPHYHFVGWSDGNTDNPRTIVVTQAINLTAIFAIDQHTVTVLSNDDNMGMVDGNGVVDYGTVVQISATAYQGYEFVSWNDGNTENPRYITVESDTTFIATFQLADGIEDMELPNVQVYAHNNQIIVNNGEGYSVEIFDMRGRLIVREDKLTQSVGRFTMSVDGVYLVKIGDRLFRKVVVTR